MNENKGQVNWFKRRRYGFGWAPVTWQGWLTILLFLAVVLFGATVLEDTPRNTFSKEVVIYLIFFIVPTTLLVVISLMKGPSPKWRWGSKATDNPDEDI